MCLSFCAFIDDEYLLYYDVVLEEASLFPSEWPSSCTASNGMILSTAVEHVCSEPGKNASVVKFLA